MRRPLTPVELAELKFLRQQVDAAEQAAYTRDPSPATKQKLYRARDELAQFTKKLREEGCLI
jgi:hypothetical protein